MIPAPPHPAEAARQAALLGSGILLIDHEERFQRIVRLAKRLFNVPIALISLTDDQTQRFKACVGLNFESAPRSTSFCGHAIAQQGCLVVPDARLDDRFHDNPYVVTDPGVRFYAGMPLQYEGQSIGTLCIVDTEPREFTVQDEIALADLAATVENEIVQHQHATQDELTGLLNRRGLLRFGKTLLKQNSRDWRATSATVLFFDLDGLKRINDTLGHEAGDEAIATFGAALASVCRGSDASARLGGDEFVVLLTNTAPESASAFTNRLDAVLERVSAQQSRYRVAYSVGAFEWRGKQSLEAVLREADAAMYRHKQAKRKQGTV